MKAPRKARTAKPAKMTLKRDHVIDDLMDVFVHQHIGIVVKKVALSHEALEALLIALKCSNMNEFRNAFIVLSGLDVEFEVIPD